MVERRGGTSACPWVAFFFLTQISTEYCDGAIYTFSQQMLVWVRCTFDWKLVWSTGSLKCLATVLQQQRLQDGSSLGIHYVEIIIAVPPFNLPEERVETLQRPFFVGDMGAFQIQTSNFRRLFVFVCLLHWFHILQPTPAQPAALWCFSVAPAPSKKEIQLNKQDFHQGLFWPERSLLVCSSSCFFFLSLSS